MDPRKSPSRNEPLRALARSARARIAAGELRGEALVALVTSLPFVDRDTFVDEMLAIEASVPDAALPRGAVPYVPSSTDAILTMVRAVALARDDTLVDLGSGLGKVAILAHLVAGCSARGIEIQEHLVRASSASAASLGLEGLEFVHANAAEITLEGSVFFLYAPFNGAMLAAVLEKIAEAASERRVTVAALDLELDDVPWLVRTSAPTHGLTIYASRPRR